MYWGKIIGAVAGFGLGHGLLGAVAGVAVGHWVDLRLGRGKRRDGNILSTQAERQRIFSTAVVNLSAKLAKIDGVVSREEVNAFKSEFIIPHSQRAGIAAIFDEAKRNALDYEVHAKRLAQAFAGQPAVLSDVLDSLHHIALVDGPLNPAEMDFLRRVSDLFGFPDRTFATRYGELTEADPYAVLGVAHGAPMSEVKAAWRRLTREHHPDTLMAKGMPADHIDFATRKMATINAAYDRIRGERSDA
ncbi:TerB family tellurite resistance protein [Telmatospirillum sp.]|uniref:TerB family tellurite resistance protein n=1 Tax=Telmatospirillum sp. TaxID=2079197 RepID=UPI0028510CBC|nr:TerB family tellurite resistance protein [Telmatospirillum sp.]MDR3435779.1 TerB family tellurite resistance protein [Telmatospirillum sp.]